MVLHQKNGLKLATTKNLEKFISLCKLAEINPALNAQVVEAIALRLSINKGFKIDVINSKFNLKTNECLLSLTFNIKNKTQVSKLFSKIFAQKIEDSNNFLLDDNIAIYFTKLSKYFKKISKIKKSIRIINSKKVYVQLSSMSMNIKMV